MNPPGSPQEGRPPQDVGLRGLRRLARDATIYLGMGFVRRVISLALLPLYTHLVSQEEFGGLDLIVAAGGLFAIASELQLSMGIARLYYSEAAAGRGREFLGASLAARVAWGLLLLAIGVAASGPVAGWLVPSLPSGRLVFCLYLVEVLLSGVEQVAMLFLRLSDRVMAYSALNVAGALTQGLASVALVAGARLGMAGIVGGGIASSLVVLAGAGWLLRRSIAPARPGATVRRAVRFSLPMVPGVLFAWGGQYLNRILFSRHVSLEEVAIFALVMKFVVVLSLVVESVRLAWHPLSMRLADDAAARDRFYRLAFESFVALGLVVCLTVVLASVPAVRLVAPESYADAALYLPLMLVGGAFASSTIFIDVGNQVAGSTHNYSISTAAGVAMNLGLLAVLVPWLGLWAPAIGYCAGNLVNAGTLMVLTGRVHRVGYRGRSIACGLAGAAAMVAFQPLAGLVGFGSPAWFALAFALGAVVTAAAWHALDPAIRERLVRAALRRPAREG